MRQGYQASFCEHDITPHPKSAGPLQGFWTSEDRKAQSVSSALKLQIILLEDEVLNRVLIVTADIFGFDEAILQRVGDATEQYGIPRSSVLLNASHTHYAPGTFKGMVPRMGAVDLVFVDRITTLIEESLPLLTDSLQPATIEWWLAEARIGFNRRLLKGDKVVMKPAVDEYYESRTPVIRVTRGKKSCLLINHGCHPTGLLASAVISSDFVGAARTYLLREHHDIDQVMFLQGAAGNIKHGDYRDGYPAWSSDEEGTKRAGERLGYAISEVIKTRPRTQSSARIDCRCCSVEIPLRSRTRTFKEELSQPESVAGSPGLVAEWANWMMKNGDTPTQNSLRMSVWTLSIGDLFLIGLPGEPVAELADLLVKYFSGAGQVVVLGYTNGLQAYLPTDKMIKEGGYEAYRSHFVYMLPSAIDLGFESKLLAAIDALKRDENI